MKPGRVPSENHHLAPSHDKYMKISYINLKIKRKAKHFLFSKLVEILVIFLNYVDVILRYDIPIPYCKHIIWVQSHSLSPDLFISVKLSRQPHKSYADSRNKDFEQKPLITFPEKIKDVVWFMITVVWRPKEVRCIWQPLDTTLSCEMHQTSPTTDCDKI